ncbi:MAG: recombination mediator RecR [Candidatus Omnitrophica bacterium]|nr:recombination mediator RecR [Candidatus Omnitrophota bacterium]
MAFPKIFNELVESLSRFPGIGKRSAERLAFYILKMQPQELKNLIQKMEEVHKNIRPCKFCNNFSTEEFCSICSNPNRQQNVICIVEEPKDVLAIEKTSQYNGLYYVLLGKISPLEGISKEDLNIRKLINRIESGKITEVIISTDPDSDGELTAHFLIQKLSQYKVKIYRIAVGIPLGTQIEYIDTATLGQALLDKKPILT